MPDDPLAPETPQGPDVGRMVVGEEHERAPSAGPFDPGTQQRRHRALDGLRVGSAESGLEFGPAQTLGLGHPTLAAQRAVGEVVEEPASGAHGQVGVEGEELGELERLEAVDDEGFGERKVL